MTQYVETFHTRAGLYTSDVVPLTFLTPQWNMGSGDFTLQDTGLGAPSTSSRMNDGVDERYLRAQNNTASWTAAKIHAFSLTRVSTFADGSVAMSTRFKDDPNLGSALILRATGTGASPTAYVALFRQVTGTTASVQIYKLVAGVYTSLGTSSTVNVSADLGVDGYYYAHARFYASGVTLKAKFWSMGVKEPTAWNLTLTDGSIGAAGFGGFGVCDPTNTVGVSSVLCGYVSVSDTTALDTYIPIISEYRRQYLEESANAAVILFEADVLGSSDGGTTAVSSTALMSTLGFTTRPGDRPANACFDGVIESVGDFTQALNDELFGRATQGFGDVIVTNENHKLDDWLRWNWDGRPFRLLVGSSGWRYCDFTLVARGSIERIESPSAGVLAFKLRDSSNILARRVQSTLVGGSEPDANKPQPISMGKPFNVTPVLKDHTTHRYKVNDGTLADILDVRENGASIIGTVTKDLANGEFTLAASPAGALTVDPWGGTSPTLYGSTADTVSGTHDSFFKRVTYIYSALTEDQIHPSPTLNVGADGTENSGLFIGHNEERNCDDLLDEIAASTAGFWYWNRWGEVTATLLDLTAAYGSGTRFSLVEDDLTNKQLRPVRLILPAELGRKTIRNKNYTVQDIATLAGAVTDPNKATYSSAGLVEVVATGSPTGLDIPSQHQLDRQRPTWITLWRTAPSSAFTRDRDNWSKAVGIFELSTRKYAMEFEIGSQIDLVHSGYGFSAGVRGQVVRISKSIRSRRATVQVAIRLTGLWPATTTAFPYVGEGDFE